MQDVLQQIKILGEKITSNSSEEVNSNCVQLDKSIAYSTSTDNSTSNVHSSNCNDCIESHHSYLSKSCFACKNHKDNSASLQFQSTIPISSSKVGNLVCLLSKSCADNNANQEIFAFPKEDLNEFGLMFRHANKQKVY